MTRFTDLALAPDADGILDLVIDEEAGDLTTVNGLETAFVLSLFSDQRALPDEVADPLERRGWDGDLYSDRPEDRFGSRYWLWIEQARLTQTERNYARLDTIDALQWMVDAGLLRSVDAQAGIAPGKRAMQVQIIAQNLDGSQVTTAWQLFANTAPQLVER